MTREVGGWKVGRGGREEKIGKKMVVGSGKGHVWLWYTHTHYTHIHTHTQQTPHPPPPPTRPPPPPPPHTHTHTHSQNKQNKTTHPAIHLLKFAANLLPLGIAPLGHQVDDGCLIGA